MFFTPFQYSADGRGSNMRTSCTNPKPAQNKSQYHSPPPKIQLFHPSRGVEAHPELFLPLVPSIGISQDILRVHFAHGMEDWSNLTWEFPGVFWTCRRDTFTRWPVSPREDNWWLGEEVTGTASEVNHQVLEEIRLRNIVRVQDLVCHSRKERVFKAGREINPCKSTQVALKKNLNPPWGIRGAPASCKKKKKKTHRKNPVPLKETPNLKSN